MGNLAGRRRFTAGRGEYMGARPALAALRASATEITGMALVPAPVATSLPQAA